jgi:hypothetical protein
LFTLLQSGLAGGANPTIWQASRGKTQLAIPSQRLRLYGMDEKAIARVQGKRPRFWMKRLFTRRLTAPVTVLNMRKGSYVDLDDQTATRVLTLQDFSQVWVEAHVPVKDLQFLSVGDARDGYGRRNRRKQSMPSR